MSQDPKIRPNYNSREESSENDKSDSKRVMTVAQGGQRRWWLEKGGKVGGHGGNDCSPKRAVATTATLEGQQQGQLRKGRGNGDNLGRVVAATVAQEAQQHPRKGRNNGLRKAGAEA